MNWIKKTILLIFYGGSINLILWYYFANYTKLYQSETHKTEQKFNTLKKNIDFLFLGHSRMLRGINDSIIPNSFNFAGSSESLPYVYYKMKNILKKSNKQVKFFVIPIGQNATMTVFDQLNANNVFWLNYFDYIEFGKLANEKTKYIALQLQTTLFPYHQYIQKFWKKENNIDKKENNFANFSDERKLKSFNLVFDRQRNDEIGFLYLNKILTLLQEHHQKAIFLKIPITNYFKQKCDSLYKNQYSSILIDSTILQNTNCTIIDFEDLFIDCDEYFFDVHHLRTNGRNVFSTILADTLAKLFPKN